ncbi:hypothetical protein [Caballeronia cordobensis]|uniref:hypothetical protein n=1 Tax=Caballeronia cordobensis TaxID=1353886 RepID=UPI0005EEA7F4
MRSDDQHDKYRIVEVLTISGLLVVLLFVWQGNEGFSLWDEGFLWYGVQRVLLGEVPIRDFMAYDPGRYYWSAILLSATGDNGIMALRVVVAIFQFLGLFVGLFLVAQSATLKRRSETLFLCIAAMTLAVWMVPRHKLFDISLSIFLIGILTFLVTKKVPLRYFIAGVCTGLVAVFGRNHGIYGLVGSLGVIVWCNIRNTSGPRLIAGLSLWAAGVAVGFTPILLMALFVPGFALAFWASVRFLFEQQATNLPVPVPWPWTVDFAALPFPDALNGLLLGTFFLAVPIFGVVSIFWVVRQKLKDRTVPPALVAAAFLSIPYAHYAFSRADAGHLAQGIFPMLVGSFVWMSRSGPGVKWSLVAVLFATSLSTMHASHPGWYCYSTKQCVDVQISGSTLEVDPATAADVALLRRLATTFAPSGQTFIAAPFWPGAYALLGRKSPVWEIYPLFHRSESFEKEEIARIRAAKPAFAVILDTPLDNREDLRFKNTHPFTYQYIQRNFVPAPGSPNLVYQIFKSRASESE